MPTRLALMRDQVRYQPGSADAVFELAYEYFRLRNYNDAAIGFKRVLLTRPNDVEALNNYAVALYRTRRGDLARESLRRAGDLAAGHAVVQRNLGVVLLHHAEDAVREVRVLEPQERHELADGERARVVRVRVPEERVQDVDLAGVQVHVLEEPRGLLRPPRLHRPEEAAPRVALLVPVRQHVDAAANRPSL